MIKDIIVAILLINLNGFHFYIRIKGITTIEWIE